ncbi:MAG: DUF2806 domain-containing protein [Chloroflexi bacterium]|nr:DUF2806 domain-containing protein [Chloroflexota bacterium]
MSRMMAVMETIGMVRALDKLLDYTASGIGAVAGPMLAPWRARREAAALQIAAQSQADSLRIIAAAQADARDALVSKASDVRGEIDIAETVRQRIQFQEEKRHGNIGSVVGRAAEELGEKEVPDQEPDHDWTARFFNYIQDVSSEEMQSLWAKVLAGEIERPGSVSIRGLSILRNLDQATAKLFQKLCSCCMVTIVAEHKLDARVPSLGHSAGENSLQQFGLSFDELNILNEHGLIISDYNSWYDMKMCIGISTPGLDQQNAILRIPFRFENRYWVLVPSDQRTLGFEYRVSGVALTQAGKDLSQIVECEPVPEYRQALASFFASQNLVMAEVAIPEPHVISSRTPT